MDTRDSVADVDCIDIAEGPPRGVQSQLPPRHPRSTILLFDAFRPALRNPAAPRLRKTDQEPDERVLPRHPSLLTQYRCASPLVPRERQIVFPFQIHGYFAYQALS